MTARQPQFSRTVPGTDWFSRTFKALHRGFQTPRTFKHWAKFWLIFKDFQRTCKKGAFKLQGPSSTVLSSDLFLRTFKGLVKKGLWNSKAFHISFKHFQRLSKPCHVCTALPKPESTQAKINLMHLNTENFTISINTQHNPIHLSTLCSSHPHNPPSHVKGDLNWRRKLDWNWKMSKTCANTDLQALAGCSITG